MKLNKSTKISFRIMALFMAAIIISIIPDYLHEFFNDVHCLGNVNGLSCVNGWQDRHGIDWHWGYRHWLFFGMGLSLSIVQFVNIVCIIE